MTVYFVEKSCRNYNIAFISQPALTAEMEKLAIFATLLVLCFAPRTQGKCSKFEEECNAIV